MHKLGHKISNPVQLMCLTVYAFIYCIHHMRVDHMGAIHHMRV